MRILLVTAFLLAGCTKANPNYCEGPACPDGPPKSCTMSDETCVCLTPPGICVQCTVEDPHNCSGTKPQCGDDHRCRACRSNDECPASGACLEDGSCADASQVIYATSNGANTAGCGVMAGQNECSLTQAITEVGGARSIIRLAAGTYMVNGPDGLDFNLKSATVIARGATLTRTPTGPLMTVRNGQTLKLVGGTLRGSNGADGLKCNTGGKLQVHESVIEKMDESGIEGEGCELTVSRATIRRNLQGGINMTGTAKPVTITNNFVYGNGQGTTSPVGGMRLQLMPAGSKVEFNTVVDNYADLNGTSAGGIACEGQGYDAPGNLVYRNQGGLGGMVQVIGTCTFMGSYRQAAATPDENVVGFEAPNNGTNPSYRLTPPSPVGTIRDATECRGMGVDFEGDARPQPAGGMCDYGADEYRDGQ